MMRRIGKIREFKRLSTSMKNFHTQITFYYPQTSLYDTDLQRSQRYMHSGQFQQALSILDSIESKLNHQGEEEAEENCIGHDKVYYTLHITFRRAMIHEALQDSQLALMNCEKLLSMESELMKHNLIDEAFFLLNTACVMKCRMLVSRNDLSGALRLLGVLIDGRLKKRLKNSHLTSEVKNMIRHDLAMALVQRASLYKIDKEYEEAVKDLTKAIKYVDTFPQPYYLRATMKICIGDLQAAKQDAERVIALAKNEADLVTGHILLGDILTRLKMNNEALEVANTMIEKYPNVIDLYIIRAIAYTQLYQFDKALIDCKSAEELIAGVEPERLVDLFHSYICCLIYLAKFDDLVLLGHKLQIIAKDYSYGPMRCTASMVLPFAKFCELEWTGHYAEALDIFNRDVEPAGLLASQELFPRCALLYDKINVLIENEQYEDALKLCDVLQEGYNHIQWKVASQLQRALVLAYLGRTTEARTLLKQYQNKMPSDTPGALLIFSNLTKARILSLSSDKIKSSIKYFQTALNLSIKFGMKNWEVKILGLMSQVENQIGMVSEARQHLLKVQEAIPRHAVYSLWKL
jgi:tetratricopeptide (TPR) repeat protein